MSNSWIRGRRCGVSNCRSKYYHFIDGQKVCSEGHVQEAHIEINDEEDDLTNAVITRRITIKGPSQSRSGSRRRRSRSRSRSGREVLFGARAKVKYLEAIQYLLRAQTRYLINQYGAPQILETVVKRVWCEFLNNFTNSRQRHRSASDSESEYLTAGSDTGSVSSTGSTMFTTRQPLPVAKHTLAIIYIALKVLHLPIFADDLIVLATTYRLPYVSGSYELPDSINEYIPTQKGLIVQSSAPENGHLYSYIERVAAHLETSIPDISIEPLLLRLVKELVLPGEIYKATLEFVKEKQIKMQISTRPRTELYASYRRSPEILTICSLAIVAKLYFLLPHFNKRSKVYDWKTWKQIVEELHDIHNDTRRGVDNLIESILGSEKVEADLMTWDDSTVNKYLDWFDENYVTQRMPSEQNIPIKMKRLYNIFDLPPKTAEEPKGGRGESSGLAAAYDKLWASELTDQKMTYDSLHQIEQTIFKTLYFKFGINNEQFRKLVNMLEAGVIGTEYLQPHISRDRDGEWN